MFETLLRTVFEIENKKCEILIPNGLLIDQYEKFGLAIINHANEIRKEAAEQEKKAQQEKEQECSTCETPCASCEDEQPKE